MKFMKLGSKLDTFYTSDGIRTVSSEISSDLIILIEGTRYLLHKFPLLSKCLRLQKLCSESPESSPRHQVIQLPEFPGGVEAFELCAKFCYGISITVSAYNIVATLCAAEYLQMSETAEKGNFIFKLQTFLNTCILQGWKDSILTLHTTKSLPALSEQLGISTRCIEAIASMVSTQPSKIRHSKNSSKQWWAEDISELGVDLYWRTMIALKTGGRVPPALIGEALQIYASKWLSNKKVNPETVVSSKHRLLLETIVSLLPAEKGAVSCSFLLKLLKAANLLNASPSSMVELATRVGMQLEEASVKDLLIPSSKAETKYDVDLFMRILEQFMAVGQSPPMSPVRIKGRYERRRRSRSSENVDVEFQQSRRSSSASHSSKLKVARIVDRYLQEIASDTKLPLSKMTAIAEAIPDFARFDHDDLYKAIDIYLKAHPELSKSERKRLCRVLDCKKLSVEACMHAAQNEHLPLRVVVQVLFCEQARAAMAAGKVTDLPPNLKALLAAQDYESSKATSMLSSMEAKDQWSISGLKSPKSNISTLKMKLAEDDLEENGFAKASKLRNLCAIPYRPKWMFCKLLSMNKNANHEKH